MEIYHTASTRPGWSGSPLISRDGRIVGVHRSAVPALNHRMSPMNAATAVFWLWTQLEESDPTQRMFERMEDLELEDMMLAAMDGADVETYHIRGLRPMRLKTKGQRYFMDMNVVPIPEDEATARIFLEDAYTGAWADAYDSDWECRQVQERGPIGSGEPLVNPEQEQLYDDVDDFHDTEDCAWFFQDGVISAGVLGGSVVLDGVPPISEVTLKITSTGDLIPHFGYISNVTMVSSSQTGQVLEVDVPQDFQVADSLISPGCSPLSTSEQSGVTSGLSPFKFVEKETKVCPSCEWVEEAKTYGLDPKVSVVKRPKPERLKVVERPTLISPQSCRIGPGQSAELPRRSTVSSHMQVDTSMFGKGLKALDELVTASRKNILRQASPSDLGGSSGKKATLKKKRKQP